MKFKYDMFSVHSGRLLCSYLQLYIMGRHTW